MHSPLCVRRKFAAQVSPCRYPHLYAVAIFHRWLGSHKVIWSSRLPFSKGYNHLPWEPTQLNSSSKPITDSVSVLKALVSSHTREVARIEYLPCGDIWGLDGDLTRTRTHLPHVPRPLSHLTAISKLESTSLGLNSPSFPITIFRSVQWEFEGGSKFLPHSNNIWHKVRSFLFIYIYLFLIG